MKKKKRQQLEYWKHAELTPEQVADQERRFALYEEYGIPFGQLDGGDYYYGEIPSTQKQADRDEAQWMIITNKEIPEDLKERLLQYKREDEANKC